MSREQLLTATFVELADTLVADFDALDFLHLLTERAVGLLNADDAGLILVDQRDELQIVASTSHAAKMLELFQVQTAEGPCLECVRSGQPLVNLDLAEVGERWPTFTWLTREAGFRSVHAIPMRLRDQVIGALSLFCSSETRLSAADVALGQALADVATIGLLQERLVRQQEIVSEQLQTALNGRILIEQAKGVLAERAHLGIEEAFALIRGYSRRTRRSLVAVAIALIEGDVEIEAMRDDHPA